MKKGLAAVLTLVCLFSQPVQAQEIQSNVIELTYEEAQELMQIAWCEAGNQGQLGQQYVMSVVINRVKSPEFPDNVHDVIYQPHQFATSGMSKAEITVDTHLALAEIEKGNVFSDIVAFETTKSKKLEKYFSEAYSVGDHTFYTLKNN